MVIFLQITERCSVLDVRLVQKQNRLTETAWLNKRKQVLKMVSLIVLGFGVVLFRGLGLIGLANFEDWQTCIRYALALMFVFTGISHFTRTKNDMVKMVPPLFPRPFWLVYLTGGLEILGAIGLAELPDLKWLVGICLILLLLALFPANIYAATSKVIFRGKLATSLWLRTPMQGLYILLLCWAIL